MLWELIDHCALEVEVPLSHHVGNSLRGYVGLSSGLFLWSVFFSTKKNKEKETRKDSSRSLESLGIILWLRLSAVFRHLGSWKRRTQIPGHPKSPLNPPFFPPVNAINSSCSFFTQALTLDAPGAMFRVSKIKEVCILNVCCSSDFSRKCKITGNNNKPSQPIFVSSRVLGRWSECNQKLYRCNDRDTKTRNKANKSKNSQ